MTVKLNRSRYSATVFSDSPRTCTKYNLVFVTSTVLILTSWLPVFPQPRLYNRSEFLAVLLVGVGVVLPCPALVDVRDVIAGVKLRSRYEK